MWNVKDINIKRKSEKKIAGCAFYGVVLFNSLMAIGKKSLHRTAQSCTSGCDTIYLRAGGRTGCGWGERSLLLKVLGSIPGWGGLLCQETVCSLGVWVVSPTIKNMDSSVNIQVVPNAQMKIWMWRLALHSGRKGWVKHEEKTSLYITVYTWQNVTKVSSSSPTMTCDPYDNEFNPIAAAKTPTEETSFYRTVGLTTWGQRRKKKGKN